MPLLLQNSSSSASFRFSPARVVDMMTVSSINTSRWSQLKKPSVPQVDFINEIMWLTKNVNNAPDVGESCLTPIVDDTIVNFNESVTSILLLDNIWFGNTVRYVVISTGRNRTRCPFCRIYTGRQCYQSRCYPVAKLR